MRSTALSSLGALLLTLMLASSIASATGGTAAVQDVTPTFDEVRTAQGCTPRDPVCTEPYPCPHPVSGCYCFHVYVFGIQVDPDGLLCFT